MTIYESRKILEQSAALSVHLYHFSAGKANTHRQSNSPLYRLLLITEAAPDTQSFMGNARHRFPLKQGYAYLRPSFGMYETYLTLDVSYIAVHFELKLFNMNLVGSADRVIGCPAPELCGLMADNAEGNALPIMLRVVTETILARMWNELFPETWWEDCLREEKYQRLFHYIETSRAPALLSVNSLADFAGMRREVFSRNFTREIGMTPKEYLIRHLMAKASSLLLNPNMRISEVAKRLGFNDEFYFSRFFKHNSGLSPTEFRKIQ